MTFAPDPFLDQIRSNPDDDDLRLVYADWLEERGDPRGDFLRLLVEQRRESPPFYAEHLEKQIRLNQLRRSCPVEWLAGVDGLFHDESIRKIIAAEMVGSCAPYNLAMESHRCRYDAANDYLKNVGAALRESGTVDVMLTEFDCFGSGYSSFGRVFCSKQNGLATVWKDGVATTTGICILLCRLAPAAVWFGASISRSSDCSGGPGFPEPGGLYVPESDSWTKDSWTREIERIEMELCRHGFTLPRAEELERRLPFQANIHTLLNFGEFRYLDAFFYRED